MTHFLSSNFFCSSIEAVSAASETGNRLSERAKKTVLNVVVLNIRSSVDRFVILLNKLKHFFKGIVNLDGEF